LDKNTVVNKFVTCVYTNSFSYDLRAVICVNWIAYLLSQWRSHEGKGKGC